MIEEEHRFVKISIKWNAERFTDLPLDIDAPLAKFRQLVLSLTGVPVEKQKLVFKGVTWKDDIKLHEVKMLKEGSELMLIGAREEFKLEQKMRFEEDLTPQEKAAILKEKAGVILPNGLINMGNTCYFNSSIQLLRRVKELNDFIKNHQVNAQSPNLSFYASLRETFKALEQSGQPFKPEKVLNKFFSIYPMFAEPDNHGHLKQQDADECFQNILSVIEPMASYKNEEGKDSNLIKDLFEITYTVTLKNGEIDEPASISQEKSKKLMCIIDNNNNPVNTLAEGLRVSLEETLMKTSPLDGLQHLYTKSVRVNKLPSYLCVQMVRFFWKQGRAGKEGVKSKILRNVAFPKILDLFDFCTPELQQQLQAGREYEKNLLMNSAKIEQDQLEQFKKNMEEQGKILPDDSREVFKLFKNQQKEQDIKKHDDLLNRKHGMGLETGNYEIVGVLTHEGREADSGHYMSWIHHSGDDWVCYNDDQVKQVKIDKILDLRGGGDWHMGYYLLYRKLEIE